MTDEKLPQDAKKKVEELRNWINRQAHLPKDLEDKLLLRFLHSCYYDIEKTKTTVELFFSIRSSTPELFAQRDLSNPALKTAIDILNVVQYEISGKRNIWLWQLNDPGLEKYDYVQDAKTFTLCFDAWLLENEEYAEEDIIMLDVKDVTIRMITKLNLSVARKLSKYQEDAMPIRMKQIHVVNAPPFIDKVFSVMKPLLKQEITEMIHFHPPKSDSIFKFFKKEELPVDLGGYLPSADEYMKKTMQGVMDKRTRILDENFWRVDKKAKNSDDVGTFRTLDID